MSEAITNEQLGRVINILFFLPVSRINNWENDNRMINFLARESGLTSDEVRRFMPLFLSNLQSLPTVNRTQIDFTSGEKLIDLFGKDKFRNGREQLISAFLNLMNAQTQMTQSVSSTNFTNNQTQNQPSSSNSFMQFTNLALQTFNQLPQESRGQLMDLAFNIGMNYLFNQNQAQNSVNDNENTANLLNDILLDDDSADNFSDSEEYILPQGKIKILLYFFENILNGSYWQGNTRVNLETLRDLNFNVGQIRAFVERLENANSFVSMRILNYEDVTNLISKIDRKALVTVEDVANVLIDLSEIYPDVNRNENIPPFEKSQDFSRE